MQQNNKEDETVRNANLGINRSFYGEDIEDINTTDGKTETELANQKINDIFYDDHKDSGSSIPIAYVNNNMPAIDITENKDK